MNLQSLPSPVAGVAAIIVSFQPDLARLGELLKSVASQTDSVVLVDNGSSEDVAGFVAALGDSRLNVLPLGKNLGIAAAHNVGIRWARERGAKYVLLMDQDSVPEPRMVAALKLAHEDLVAGGDKVAAIGPRFRDPQTGHLAPHVRFGRIRFAPVACEPGQPVVLTDLLISSGSLISIDVLDAVGGMDEEFFIDQVDTEWVLRARAKGYQVWGHCEASMSHSLGEQRRRVWLGRWREIPLHKPFRYYYMFRNSVLLQRRDYPCWAWRRVDTVRLLQMFVFLVMFHPQRFQALQSMLRGLWDGVQADGSK
ncbi:rhamnosyltransferase [Paraburkholderia sp. HC6.4b]|uniref:glycosyltransferase family 2 protein n=1 Tax=unclassified Paraburkholderia TaxID=2615204 RepID=UPI00160EF34B|nr:MULTISPECIES: glycosyltransferase family 2 protein [unclassified Paraburkholderia]MBB5413929.1 rhamnosyltransferase [Paraburkholderia sp. HC6.4b]MBB5456329.1 rhamnosyltransferase [Paraburkholderia sp. Kb1A]